MSILTRLLHPQASPGTSAGESTYRGRDNRGTRHDTLDKASSYWMARIASSRKDPFVMYVFDRPADARAALLELPCIHEAVDTHDVISTEVLIFGYYRTEQGTYEALVCGDDLTHALWEQAHESFARHGGRKKNDLEPEVSAQAVQPATTAREAGAPAGQQARPATTAPGPTVGDASKVRFVREDRKPSAMGKTWIYRIHRAPDAASAKAFLEEHPVTDALLYLLVETPEGTYGRDVGGMYKE